MYRRDDLPALWLPTAPAIIRPRAIFQPGFRGAPQPPAALSLTSSTQVIAAQSTNTFSSQALGSPSAGLNSLVAVIVHGLLNDTFTLTSVTIDGVTATVHVTANIGTATSSGALIAIATAATANTTGTITVVFSKVMSRCIISVYRLTWLRSTTPDDADHSEAFASSWTITNGIDTVNSGIMLAGMSQYVVNATDATLSGVTTDYTSTIVSTFHSVGGSSANLATASARAVSAAGPAAGNGGVAAVSFH